MDHREHLKNAKRIASILDTKFSVLGLKFGFDPLFSIIPGLGSVIGAITSTYIFWIAYNLGVPVSLYLRMGLNILIDFLIGEVPIVGIFVDIFYRSNTKNIKLVEEFLKPEAIDAEVVDQSNVGNRK